MKFYFGFALLVLVGCNSRTGGGSPAPVINSISPVYGPNTGGSSVTITGEFLGTTTSVEIGDVAVTNFTINSATSITCTTPARIAGLATVRVTTPGGSDTCSFTYDPDTWTFVDGNDPLNGLNKSSSEDADAVSATVFNSKLYVIWGEASSGIKNIRVVVYNGNDSSPGWSFVDGNGVTGLNHDSAEVANNPQFAVLGNKLYATWIEEDPNSHLPQLRVVVYNGNDSAPSWTFVDGNGIYGLNLAFNQGAYYPHIAAFNSKLYVSWQEPVGGINQIHVMVYNGNDSSPSWSLVDGGALNHDPAQHAGPLALIVFNSKLYASWSENNGITGFQMRCAVYNGNDSSPSWSFVDGDTTTGLNFDTTVLAQDPAFGIVNSKLYLMWRENNPFQLRVAVYNGDDSSPSWSFVDGNGTNGINHNSLNDVAVVPTSGAMGGRLYVAWLEDNSVVNQQRVAAYNGDDGSPSWSFLDGDAVTGINKDVNSFASTCAMAIFSDKLYVIWSEYNGSGLQIRAAVGQ